MDEIKFPAILIIDNRIEVFDKGDIELTCTLLSYKEGTVKDINVYDSEGDSFKSVEAVSCRKIRSFEKFLTFIWNPFIRVKLNFRKLKTKVNITKLKSTIKKIIRMDDDIYCQFIEKDDIYKMLDSSQSVKDLIVNVKKILEAELEDSLSQ